MLFGKEVKDYKKCLSILHGFTNRVINERRIEFREERKNNKMTKEEKEEMNLLGKKKRLAFLGRYRFLHKV